MADDERNESFFVSFDLKGKYDENDKDNTIQREFHDYKNTSFGKALAKLKRNEELKKELAKVIGETQKIDPNLMKSLIEKVLSPQNDYYGKQKVQWYYNEFIDSIENKFIPFQKNFSTLCITVKSCKNYYFYSLKGEKGDNWELLHSPYFLDVVYPKNVKEVEKVRGFADTILFLAPRLVSIFQENKKKEQLESRFKQLIEWFTIDLQLTEPEYENDVIKFKLNPIIGINKEIKIPPKDNPITLVSSSFRNSVKKLGECWLNPTAKSILFSACSGTGKEVLVNLFMDAMCIDEERRLTFSAPSIKDFNIIKNEIKVKYYNENNEDKENKTSDKNNNLLDDRVILFFDEIHHDESKELRSNLLRLIESEEFDFETKKIKCSNIIFIFTASLVPEKLFCIPPIDFWTRIEHVIKVSHPLRINITEERKEILEEYFLIFWDQSLKKFDQSISLAMSDSTRKKLKIFKREEWRELAKVFSNELFSPLIPLISMRTLRSIIKNLLGKTINLISTQPYDGHDTIFKKIILSFKEEWIVEIFNEIAPENNDRLF